MNASSYWKLQPKVDSRRVVKRANILLMAGARQYIDSEISQALSAGKATAYRIKRDFVEHGLEAALAEDDRPGGARKLNASQAALLVSMKTAANNEKATYRFAVQCR